MIGKSNAAPLGRVEGKVVYSVADATISNKKVDYPPSLVTRYNGSVNTTTWEYGDEYYMQDGLFYIKNPTTKTYNLSNYNEATKMFNYYSVCISSSTPRTQLWEFNSRNGDQSISYSSNSYGTQFWGFSKQDYYYTITTPVSRYVTSNSNTDYPNNDWKNNKYYIKVYDLT